MTTGASSQSAMHGPQAAMAARVAAAGTMAVALIIVALHAIKPEFEPSWRFISEYAIGPYGWIMKLAFLIWAASCAALALALRREVTRQDRPGRSVARCRCAGASRPVRGRPGHREAR